MEGPWERAEKRLEIQAIPYIADYKSKGEVCIRSARSGAKQPKQPNVSVVYYSSAFPL